MLADFALKNDAQLNLQIITAYLELSAINDLKSDIEDKIKFVFSAAFGRKFRKVVGHIATTRTTI